MAAVGAPDQGQWCLEPGAAPQWPVDDGLGSPQHSARPGQAARLKTMNSETRLPDMSAPAHLNGATWHVQSIARKRTGGGSPFDNLRARHAGPPDDAALDAPPDRRCSTPCGPGWSAATSPGRRPWRRAARPPPRAGVPAPSTWPTRPGRWKRGCLRGEGTAMLDLSPDPSLRANPCKLGPPRAGAAPPPCHAGARRSSMPNLSCAPCAVEGRPPRLDVLVRLAEG